MWQAAIKQFCCSALVPYRSHACLESVLCFPKNKIGAITKRIREFGSGTDPAELPCFGRCDRRAQMNFDYRMFASDSETIVPIAIN
jgi:hypothetical protein